MSTGGITSFAEAFAALIGNEGDYSNNPDDPGGETMWGITRRVADANGYAGEMRDLSLDVARQIAKKQYWDKFQCDQLPIALAFQVFDAAYNGGYAAKWLQQAVGVMPDGVIAAKTIAAARSIDVHVAIMRFDAYRLQYLATLKTWPDFGRGWANRIANNLLLGANDG